MVRKGLSGNCDTILTMVTLHPSTSPTARISDNRVAGLLPNMIMLWDINYYQFMLTNVLRLVFNYFFDFKSSEIPVMAISRFCSDLSECSVNNSCSLSYEFSKILT